MLAKERIVKESTARTVDIDDELGVRVKESTVKTVLVVDEVREWVASVRKLDRNDNRLERATTLRNAMKAAGLVDPQRKPGKEMQRFKFKEASTSYVVANFVIAPEDEWKDIKAFHTRPTRPSAHVKEPKMAQNLILDHPPKTSRKAPFLNCVLRSSSLSLGSRIRVYPHFQLREEVKSEREKRIKGMGTQNRGQI